MKCGVGGSCMSEVTDDEDLMHEFLWVCILLYHILF